MESIVPRVSHGYIRPGKLENSSEGSNNKIIIGLISSFLNIHEKVWQNTKYILVQILQLVLNWLVYGIGIFILAILEEVKW